MPVPGPLRPAAFALLPHPKRPFYKHFPPPGTAVSPSFTLYDTGTPSTTYPNSITFGPIHVFGNNSVTESLDAAGIFTLSDVQCTVDTGGGTGSINYVTIDFIHRNVAIGLSEGSSISCTCYNTLLHPTASNVAITGQITDQYGAGVKNAVLYLVPPGGSPIYQANTNGFGYYRFDEVPAGSSYVLNLGAKGYIFSPATMIIDVNDNISGLNFVAVKNAARSIP